MAGDRPSDRRIPLLLLCCFIAFACLFLRVVDPRDAEGLPPPPSAFVAPGLHPRLRSLSPLSPQSAPSGLPALRGPAGRAPHARLAMTALGGGGPLAIALQPATLVKAAVSGLRWSAFTALSLALSLVAGLLGCLLPKRQRATTVALWAAQLSALHRSLFRRKCCRRTVGVSPGVRVFCMSDVHTDIPANLDWIRSIDPKAYQRDVLICAGDISDNLAVVETTLALLKERFRDVFFVPGNHELWVMARDREHGITDSLQKQEAVLAVCRRLHVHTTPQRIQAPGDKGFWIVPMLSWHHKSWDTEPDVEDHDIPSPEKMMRDYRLCAWPPGMDPLGDGIAVHVDRQNDAALAAAGLDYAAIAASGLPIISFSHFLPFLELLPEKRYLFYPNLAKASGSSALAARVEALRPMIHVFGHTHFGWDMTLKGIRFVQAALGYPTERKQRLPSLEVGCFPDEPLLLYDTEGGPSERFAASWSDHYLEHARAPDNVTLAPWVTAWPRRQR